MSTNEPNHFVFQGDDLKECERFIAAVNKYAHAEGRFWDDQWIAEFAAIHLAGDALIWWSLLERETQCSWQLLRKAMISRFRPLFYGKSGAEAEDFVSQIRQRALHVGKLNDLHWTAEFASGCFMGSALRWYMSLKPGARKDWDSLQRAIFVQYGRQELEQDFSSAIVPTPALAAAAPHFTRSRLRGRIRIHREDNSKIYYLSKVPNVGAGQCGRLMATAAVSNALEVECESLRGPAVPKTFFIPDNQIKGCDALGLQWYEAETVRGSSFLAFCGVQSNSATGSAGGAFRGPVVTRAWVIPSLMNDKQPRQIAGTTESGDRLTCVSTQGNYTMLWFRTSKRSSDIDLELFFERI